MAQTADTIALFDSAIIARAARDSFAKLNPARLIRNPVIFVTEVVAVLVTILAVRNAATAQPWTFPASIAAWLWLTVLFATFAEAVAEGRGRARAESLRRARSDAVAKVMANATDRTRVTETPASALRSGSIVLVETGDLIPSDGEIIEGVASVNESAVTGESAPVIREAGRRPQRRYRRHAGRVGLAGGPHHRRPRQHLPGPHDQPGRGRVPSQDAERDRARHPAGRPDNHLPDRGRDAGGPGQVLRHRPGRAGAGGAAGDADPHHHRRPAVRHRHRRHGPPGTVQRGRHVRPRRGGRGRRGHPAAGQDGHDHLRQPHVRRADPGAWRGRPRHCRGRRDGLARRRHARGPVHPVLGARPQRPGARDAGRWRGDLLHRQHPGVRTGR